jgi:hypothetical protein
VGRGDEQEGILVLHAVAVVIAYLHVYMAM